MSRAAQKKGRRGALLVLTIGGVVVAGIASVFAFGDYRINTTPSFPLGLWQIGALDREVQAGDTVFICPPANEPAFNLARERGYLPGGLCEGGLAPLIKTVAALPGQTVGIENGHVVIDGQKLAHSTIQPKDGQDRELSAYAGGIIPAGAIFVHSDYVASYDSRYFGPIPASGVLGLAHQVFTLQP